MSTKAMRPGHALLITTAAVAILWTAGCSDGSSASGDLSRLRCADGATFCVATCNLGCSLGTCGISDIAENQPIELVFSQPIDAATVTTSSFSIKTVGGAAPRGRYVVSGSTVRFAPEVQVQGGRTFFGFARNQQYVVDVAAGAQGILSISGDQLGAGLSCTVAATGGIIDLDQSPPTIELVQPTSQGAIPLDPTLVLRASELIDPTPFGGVSSSSSPLRFELRPAFDSNGSLVCDEAATPLPVQGTPVVTTVLNANGQQVSEVTLTPAVILPRSACLRITVSTSLLDLSGRSAVPRVFDLFTTSEGGGATEITERFANEMNLDGDISSGNWDNGARPGLLGGSGELGVFDVASGTVVGPSVFELNTDMQVIPGNFTPTGQAITVIGGVFEFTNFTVPAGATVRFSGSMPAIVRATGKIEIHGGIESNGGSVSGSFNARDLIGQSGVGGGCFASAGGAGGDRGDNVNALPNFSGNNGGDAQLLAGHAYAGRAIGTGGRGSGQYPAAGVATSFALGIVFCGQVNSGGSGGSLAQQGGAGIGGGPPPNGLMPAAPTTAGPLLNLFPVPAGASSIDHFMVGGSGGGGAGTHPFLTTGFATTWSSGGGGAGGGGAVTLRAGNLLSIANGASISLRGGSGGTYTGDNTSGVSAPGGGGSGGSILLQSGVNVLQTGLLDLSGGTGGSFADPLPAPGAGADSDGGDGGGGLFRIETPDATALSGMVLPNASVGTVATLTDRDPNVISVSLWIPTRLVFPPNFERYVAETTVNGAPMTFSDDASISPMVANDPNGPFVLQFQGSRLNGVGEPEPSTIGDWTPFVGGAPGRASLQSSAATAYRFRLIYNTAAFPDVVINSLTVRFSN